MTTTPPMTDPEAVARSVPTCHGCPCSHTFKPRDDERERYGFGEIGYGCKHPVDGGVYVLDPMKPHCLRPHRTILKGAADHAQ